MAGLQGQASEVQPKDTKSLTEVRRYKDSSGTYEVTLVEKSRRKLTTKDELRPIIAEMAERAQRHWEHESKLRLLGREDPYTIFADEFLHYLEEDPSLFNDFLAEITGWSREAKRGVTT